MRGTRKTAVAATDGCRFRTAANLFREETRQMLRNRRIGSVGQSQFLETMAALPRRQFAAANLGKESLDQNCIEVFTRQFCLDGPADELGARAKQRDWVTVRLG